MSDHYEVFFDPASPDRSKESVADVVAEALGVPLTPADDPDRDYRAERDGVWFDLYSEHGMSDDAGIPFERMPYSLTVRSSRVDLDRQREIAEGVFERLAAAGFRPVHLVWGIERSLRHVD